MAGRSDYKLLEEVCAPIGRGLRGLLPKITRTWCDEYRRGVGSADICEVRLPSQQDPNQLFRYLFDCEAGRAVAAYGFVRTRNETPRSEADKRLGPRQTGSPYDRGHLMAHLLGGGGDINVFRQHRSVNRGAFQRIEELALEHRGAFYFVHPIYGEAGDYTARQVEQGLLFEQGERVRFEYALFGN